MFRSSKTELKDKGLVTVERKKKKKANQAEGNKLAENRYKDVGCGCTVRRARGLRLGVTPERTPVVGRMTSETESIASNTQSMK